MTPVFRIDSFAVPETALADFTTAVDRSMAVLRTQPGFVRGDRYDKAAGDGRFNLVTVVEWADMSFLPAAAHTVQEAHRLAGFDAAAFIAAHGIADSKAIYTLATA